MNAGQSHLRSGESGNAQEWCLGSCILFDALTTACIVGLLLIWTAVSERIIRERGLGTTRSRLPVRLVWHLRTTSKSEAFKEEYSIKRLQKAEKQLLVASHPDGELEYSNLVGGITVNKAELVSKLAEDTKVTKKVAGEMLTSLVKTLQYN